MAPWVKHVGGERAATIAIPIAKFFLSRKIENYIICAKHNSGVCNAFWTELSVGVEIVSTASL